MVSNCGQLVNNEIMRIWKESLLNFRYNIGNFLEKTTEDISQDGWFLGCNLNPGLPYMTQEFYSLDHNIMIMIMYFVHSIQLHGAIGYRTCRNLCNINKAKYVQEKHGKRQSRYLHIKYNTSHILDIKNIHLSIKY